MGFSLGNLLRQAVAQVNPFDGGQTAATVRQAQQHQQAAAQLPAPGQRTSIQQPQYNQAPQPQMRVMPTIAPLHIAQPNFSQPHIQQPLQIAQPQQTQGIHVGNQLVQQAPTAHASMQAQPQHASLAHNLTNNDVTGFLGDAVAKPFFINPAQNAIETGRAINAEAHHNLPALQASQHREAQNLQKSLPVAMAKPLFNAGKANTVDLAKQVAGQVSGNKVAEQNANNAYMRDINASPIGQLLNVPQRKLASYQVHRDLPNLTANQQKAATGQSLASVGINPKDNALHQGLSTGLAALQLTAPTYGLAKAGIEGTTAGQYLKGATMLDMAQTGARGVKNIIQTQAKTVNELARGVQNPHPDVSPEDYMALRRVTNQAQGGPEIDRPVSAGDLVATRSLLKQKGLDPNDLGAADRIVNQINGYEAKKLALHQGAIRPFSYMKDDTQLPGGKTQLNGNGKPTITTKAADAAKAMLGDTQAPQTLYHGTAKGNNFDQFSLDGAGKGNSNNSLHQGNAVYLTDNKQAADYFSKQATRNAKLRDRSLSLEQATGGPDESGVVHTVKLAPNATVKALDHRPTAEEAQALQKRGVHAISFPETAFGNIEGSSANQIKSRTTVVFDPKHVTIDKPALPANQAGSLNIGEIGHSVRQAAQKLAKPFKDSSGSAPLIEDGSAIPTIKKLAGRAQAAPHEAYAKNYGDALHQMEAGLTGGQLIPDGAGGKTLISEHSPFYRKYFAQNGREPTKAAYHEEAIRQLEAGKADSYAQKEYNDLKNPEVASLLTQGDAYHAPDTTVGNVLESQVKAQSAPAAKPAVQSQPKAAPAKQPTEQASGTSSSKVTPLAEMSAKTGQTPAQRQAELDAGIKAKPATNQNKSAFTAQDQQKLSQPDTAAATHKESAQKALDNSQETPLRTAEQNRALNPVKSDLQHVPQGNHNLAITQAQMVQNHVQLHATQVLTAFDKLSKGEQSNFMRSVENLPADATPELKQAVSRWKAGANIVHAHSQSDFMGGNTNYLKNYALHSWDLPADYGNMEQTINGGGKDFQGLNNISRKHATIAEGESKGLKLNDNPKDVRKQIESYFGASGAALRKQALRQGFIEADSGEMKKVDDLHLGVGDNIPLSAKGLKAARGVQWAPKSTNKAVVGYRKVNRGLTSALLTHSGVHEMNITSRAAPGLALKGHLLAALKAAAGGLRGNVDKGYIDHIRQSALEDGMANKAAMIGAPYSTGHGLLDRQLTPIHNQVVRSVIHDLEKKGTPLTSQAARNAGKAAAGMMGEYNYALGHISPGASRAIGDIFLARQFTPSKFVRVGQAATDMGLGGHYARATMAGNALLATGTIAALGYAFKQKSDDLKDSLIRAVLAPSVPTPITDAKGNNQQIRLLGTDTSDMAKLLGITMTRNSDGHLGVTWNPKNLPTTTADFFRSRLSPMLGDGLKIVTDTNYAGKPLFQKNAPIGTQAIQAGTTLATGSLPIAAQTLAYSKFVKNLLPPTAQTIQNANTPKSNVATNAALGVVGGAIATDKTVGKALQAQQYFAASKDATKGLTPNQLALYNAVHPQTKDPVTGNFQTTPSIYDSQNKATTYLKGPDGAAVLAADNKLNQALAAKGQQIDPFYKLTPDQQNIALNYSARAQGDTQRGNYLKAYPFLTQLSNDRNSFFSNLPQGATTDNSGNTKAQLPAGLQYPKLTPAEQALTDKYYTTTSPTTKKQLLNDPAMAAAVNKVKTYSANIAAVRRTPDPKSLPGYQPPAPKNPNSKSTGNSTKTTYDPKTNTWTRTSSKTGRTTVIDANGNPTVTNAGTRKARGSSGSGRKVSASTGAARARTVALGSYAKYSGSANPMKYEKSLRALVQKTYKAPSTKGSSTVAKVKTYKAPRISMGTSLKPKKAFV